MRKVDYECENVVEIENLVKRYGDLIAVDHFNMSLKKGEILGLLGPNGSGKTTTLNCILSLLSFDKGKIEVFGSEVKPTAYEIKNQIGVVMQNVAVFDTLTVQENIDFFCGLYISDKKKRGKCVEDAIKFVGLEDYRKFRPKKLSGGLLRRLNIACGIAHKPKLILLDEPTVAVDPQSRNAILEGIKKLNKEGATIIYTSHYMEEVEDICSRIIIMDQGKNLAGGTLAELKGMIKNHETITIEIENLADDLLDKIKKVNHVYSVDFTVGKLTIKCNGGSHNLIHIMNLLMEMNVPFGRVNSQLPSLNDVFLEITGKELRD